MNFHWKITEPLRQSILADLGRTHSFAAERVGFISCRPATTPSSMLIVACEYMAVDDDDYLPDPSVGAMMGPNAIRKALQIAYNAGVSMFHVHLHDHSGAPGFSRTDLRETAKFVPDFFNVQPNLPHGAVVLSNDSAIVRCWPGEDSSPVWASKITLVGKTTIWINKL